MKKHGQPYDLKIKCLRKLIRLYFTTDYNFNHVEFEENELLFVLLVCNTFDIVKSVAKKNKKLKQYERKQDIALLILELRDSSPNLDQHLRKVFYNPCIPQMTKFFSNPIIKQLWWGRIQKSEALKNYLNYIEECGKLQWYTDHIQKAAPEYTSILP